MPRRKGLKELAREDYVSGICESLKGNFDREHQRLANAGSYVFGVQDVAKFKENRTFQIDRDGLPEALERDWVAVYLVGSAKQVARGSIARFEHKSAKIILDSKPKFEETKEKTEDADQKFEIRLDVARYDEHAMRIRCAIDRFALFSSHLQNCLLNHYEELSNTKFLKTRVLNLADSPKLSKKQHLAVEQSLMKRISLIEGVAGSGKTLVAANIAFSMSRTHEKRRRVLLCSPLQSTVNKLAKILSSEYGISVIQLTPNLISDRCDVSRPCLKETAKQDAENLWYARVRKHQPFPTKSKPYLSEFRIRRAERARLEQADVVCCTLEQTLESDCLRSMDFKALVIDDAQYATEYECLLALRFKGIKQVTLIGDMRRSEQLVSHSMRSGRNRSLDRRTKNHCDRRFSFIADNHPRRSLTSGPDGLDRNHHNSGGGGAEIGALFDRWLARGLPSVVLKFRYRKFNKLDVFLRQYFYSFDTASLATISRKVSTEQRLPGDRLAWPPKGPIMFDIKSELLKEFASRLTGDIRKWDKAASICMIKNHEPATRKLVQGDLVTEVGCVNDFLGQQRDYVILVCRKTAESRVKQKSRMKNDFLRRDDALMIALTRACYGLFVITDLAETIHDDITGDNSQPAGEGWKSLVRYFREENLVLQEYPKTEQENRAGSSKNSP